MTEPWPMLERWFADAEASDPAFYNAAALATADRDGRPSSRIVLLKRHDRHGVEFFTNLASRKARDLADRPDAAICLFWPGLGRQLRIEGSVTSTSSERSDAYFRLARPGLADRCLGVSPIRTAGRSCRPGRADRGTCRAVRRARGRSAAFLGRLCDASDGDRILVGRRGAITRATGISSSRRRMDYSVAIPLMAPMPRPPASFLAGASARQSSGSANA